MVGVVDAAALDKQVISLRIALQHRDRRPGHFRQAGFAGTIPGAIMFELHMAGFEQSQQGKILRGRDELLRIPGIGAPGMALFP